MNMQHAQNLSTKDFVRMFEHDAKTELEQALFSRLTDYLGVEVVENEFDEIFGTMEEMIADAENELDDIMDNSPDDISDPVAKQLHNLAVRLSETNDTQRTAYEAIEFSE